MATEDPITTLIFEDLKLYQFIKKLETLDVYLEYYPDLTVVVARLLDIPFGETPDAWMDIYHA